MGNNSEGVKNIDISIERATTGVNKMNSVFALHNNKDFVAVIEKGYFEEEASRLVLLKADPSLQDSEAQAAIIRSIDAIGHFRQYLSTVVTLGRMMEKSLMADIETKREMQMEGEE